MSQLFSEIWYATEDRALSRSKVIVYDDIGQLEVDPKALVFRGATKCVELTSIAPLQLASQRWNWVVYLFANIVALPVYLLWYLIFSRMFDANPIYWFVSAVVLVNAFGYVIGRSTKWIVVDGELTEGTRVRSYFADGSKRGWGGIMGGTRRLYEQIQQIRAGR